MTYKFTYMYFYLKQELERGQVVGSEMLPPPAWGRVKENEMKKILPWAAAALALSLPVSTRQAQALELKVADSFPAGHYLVRLMLKPWMDDVTKRTNGAVTFTYYPNQQIGKAADMLRLTQSGVVDIGYIGPSYVSDKMPLSEVAQLPGAFETACQGTLAYWKTAREGVLAKQEYVPNKIKLLFEVVLPPYQVWTAKQKVGHDQGHGWPEAAYHRRRARPDLARARRGAGAHGCTRCL
ncbi:hypothetical protein ACVW1A_001169 [Bradyrhizobium sp. LB1.3]